MLSARVPLFILMLLVALAFPAAAQWENLNLDQQPSYGPADAPVTVVSFYDFQCKHCARTLPVLLDVVKQYDNLVRLATVNVPAPGHPYATKAAEISLIAQDQGKFWDIFPVMFKEQSLFCDAYFLELSKRFDLPEKEVADVVSEANPVNKQLRNNFMAAVDLGVEATPTVYIGEVQLVGKKDADVFRYYLNEALAAKNIKSPVGPVEKPEMRPDKNARIVPAKLIYPVSVAKPTDSVLKVKVGDKAPGFVLPTIDIAGEKADLQDHRNKRNVVLSFIPAAWTPVCSGQWPEYAEEKNLFEQHETVLIGISVDNIPSLYAWTGTMGPIWFQVASDFYPHGEVADKYGVLRSNGVTERAVFLIDKKGIIRYIDVHDINTSPSFDTLKAEILKLTN